MRSSVLYLRRFKARLRNRSEWQARGNDRSLPAILPMFDAARQRRQSHRRISALCRVPLNSGCRISARFFLEFRCYSDGPILAAFSIGLRARVRQIAFSLHIRLPPSAVAFADSVQALLPAAEFAPRCDQWRLRCLPFRNAA
jgi:hypothetical protein